MLRFLTTAALLCGCAGASPDGALEPDDGELILFGSEPDPATEDAGPPDAGVPAVEPGRSPSAEPPDRETEPATPPPAPAVPGGTTGHGEPEGPTP